MRRTFLVGLLFLFAGCMQPSGERFVVYFDPSSAALMDSSRAVVAAAADWANKHPDMPVKVAVYADPTGSPKANDEFTRLRGQAVIDALGRGGVAAGRIQQIDVGSVGFEADSHESRRVEITVGTP
jgi:outer membrane protein OmpA-like peptidoglycan-associated protein